MDSNLDPFEKFFSYIESQNSLNDYSTGLVLLQKLVNNIVQNPLDDKFRHIKKSVKTLQQKLYNLKNIESLLQAMGFERSEDGYFLPTTQLGTLIQSLNQLKWQTMIAQARQVSDEEYEKTLEIVAFQKQTESYYEKERQQKQKLQDISENDKKERKQNTTFIKDSVAKETKFGANVKKCEDIGINKVVPGQRR